MNWNEFTPRVTTDAKKWVAKFGMAKPSSIDSVNAAKLAANDLGCDEEDWDGFEDQYIEVFEKKVWRLQTAPPNKEFANPELVASSKPAVAPKANLIQRIMAAVKGWIG